MLSSIFFDVEMNFLVNTIVTIHACIEPSAFVCVADAKECFGKLKRDVGSLRSQQGSSLAQWNCTRQYGFLQMPYKRLCCRVAPWNITFLMSLFLFFLVLFFSCSYSFFSCFYSFFLLQTSFLF